ncbi:EF-hand calcium-binding domain-containing protein 13, partial [Lemmus lemmus]
VGLNSLEGEKVSREDLEDFLKDLGITSFKDEVEKIFQSDIVSDNTVSVKDCTEALRDSPKLSSFAALKEAIDTLDSMKGSYQSDKDSSPQGLENAEGLLKEITSFDNIRKNKMP